MLGGLKSREAKAGAPEGEATEGGTLVVGGDSVRGTLESKEWQREEVLDGDFPDGHWQQHLPHC